MSAPAVLPAQLRELTTAGKLRPASALRPRTNAFDERVLPVRDDLVAALPFGGLRKGSAVTVLGSTSLLFALLAEATTQGSWAALVGFGDIGVLAAAELGVQVQRLASIPRPGAESMAVLGAVLDGFDVVVIDRSALSIPAHKLPAFANKMAARARQSGSVLLIDEPWPGADLCLSARERRWTGLGAGHGSLRGHQLDVRTEGAGHRQSLRLSFPCGAREIVDEPLRVVGRGA